MAKERHIPTPAQRGILELLEEGAWISVGEMNATPAARLEGTPKNPPRITYEAFEELRDRGWVEEVEDPNIELDREKWILAEAGHDALADEEEGALEEGEGEAI